MTEVTVGHLLKCMGHLLEMPKVRVIRHVFLNLFDRFSQKRILSYPCGATASQYFWRPVREKAGVGESGSNPIIQHLVCMSVLYFLLWNCGTCYTVSVQFQLVG